MAKSGPLKLLARGREDLEIIAACLQDALVPLADVLYQKREKRFVMVANRFRWELLGPGDEAAGAPPTQTPPTEPTLAEPPLAAPALAETVGEAAAAGGADTDAGDPDSDDARFEDADAEPLYQRVNCGVRIEKVTRVRTHGVDPGEKDQILNLLTVVAEPRAVTLHFSGGGAIRIDTTETACVLEDLGEPWPTSWRPSHRPPSHRLPSHRLPSHRLDDAAEAD